MRRFGFVFRVLRPACSSCVLISSPGLLAQVLSHEAAHQVKQLGLENDLIDRIRSDAYFDPIKPELDTLLDPASFIGRAPEQVDAFLKGWVAPALADKESADAIRGGGKVELAV